MTASSSNKQWRFFRTILAVSALSISTTFAGPDFYENYDVALAAAEKYDKPVILIFTASWCPPCQQMKQFVYPSKEVEPYHDSFIWTSLDVDDPRNQGVAQAYRTQGLPYFAFLTADGQYLGHMMGGAYPTQFKGVLEQVLAHVKKTPRLPKEETETKTDSERETKPDPETDSETETKPVAETDSETETTDAS